jgi:hypothetical protein
LLNKAQKELEAQLEADEETLDGDSGIAWV